jgi:hypothetical protein
VFVLSFFVFTSCSLCNFVSFCLSCCLSFNRWSQSSLECLAGVRWIVAVGDCGKETSLDEPS